jgi:hypothetical protein
VRHRRGIASGANPLLGQYGTSQKLYHDIMAGKQLQRGQKKMKMQRFGIFEDLE